MNTQTQANPIFEPWNVRCSAHSIRRFQERSGNSAISELKAAHGIRNILQSGKEVVLKDKVAEVRQMLAHDCKKATYFKLGELIAVIEDDVVVTVHLGEANRWIPKP